jgi:4-hydroxy-3-methylbut-2-enyl diphosphate reductase
MKQFDIPEFYRSPIIAKVKAKRKLDDPRKQDFSPTLLPFSKVTFVLPRHFGFCYGVENAIEKSYLSLKENPGKRIFLLSEMIHNPAVNEDLLANGIQFLQNTSGEEIIPFTSLTKEDIVIIPAFGTTIEIAEKLRETGANIESYNTTCPFVEKVWNRAQKLGETEHTIIIHGKHSHEETRATFSHSQSKAPSLVIKNMEEAQFLGDVIKNAQSNEAFFQYFAGKYSQGFDPSRHLNKIGVVNQTTMLATETQEITDYLRQIMLEVHGPESIKHHMADTRDTLCYATNDNQSSTYKLAETKPDFALVIGGSNSSNTSHLVEILEATTPTFFISDAKAIESLDWIYSYNIHAHEVERIPFVKSTNPLTIALTSGASCPDSIVDRVMLRVLELMEEPVTIEEALNATFEH